MSRSTSARSRRPNEATCGPALRRRSRTFLSVLGISLFLIVPSFDPASLGLWLGVIALFGLLRAARNVRMVVAGQGPNGGRLLGPRLPTIRRIGWRIVADLLLALTAWRLAATSGEAKVVPNLVAVVFVLMLGAADIAWEILTDVGREADAGREAGPDR